MYSSAFTPKSYVSFSDSAVITLLTDSIIGILLFYNSVTLPSLVMRMNDDHARIGILIVLPLFDG
nr:MAG TPA: hypothetical protein [Caudoviricetes sp.]